MQMNIIYLACVLFFSLACVAPINDDPAIRKDTTQKEYSTSGDYQNTTLQVWDWSAMDLPIHPWADETKFGDDFYVDSAYDPAAVTLVGKNLRFFVDPIVPANQDPEKFNYRAEIHTAPWPIEHALGTEQWLGWEYTFGSDYKIDETSPITIFQNHPGVRGLSPQIELEIAALNTPSPAQGGEIQIINEPNGDRLVTNVKPIAGDRLKVVIHIIYGIEGEGLLTVWLNGQKYYDKKVSTVYSEHPWGGNNKWGIYHHTFNGSESNVATSLENGAENVELFMGTLRTWTRSPGHPDYGNDAYELVRPEN